MIAEMALTYGSIEYKSNNGTHNNQYLSSQNKSPRSPSLAQQISGYLIGTNSLKDDLKRTLTSFLYSKPRASQMASAPSEDMEKESKRGISLSEANSDGLSERKNCTAINDNRANLIADGRQPQRARLRANSIAAQTRWLSSVAISLAKSQPLPARRERSSLIVFGQKNSEQTSSSSKLRLSSQPSKVDRLFTNKRHSKAGLLRRIARFDTWLADLSASFVSTLSLLLLINFVFTTLSPTALGASLSVPWLQAAPEEPLFVSSGPDLDQLDAVLSTDELSNSADLEPTPGSDEINMIADESARTLLPSSSLHANSLNLEEPNLLSDHENKATDDAANSEDGLDGGQFIVMERRRLDRDRAQEPPPWLRVPPMRRDGLDLIPRDEPGTFDGSLIDSEPHSRSYNGDAVARQAANMMTNQHRMNEDKLVQSWDEIYQKILMNVIEQALEDPKILNQIYEELKSQLEARQQSAPKADPQLTNEPATAIDDLLKSSTRRERRHYAMLQYSSDLSDPLPRDSSDGLEGPVTLEDETASNDEDAKLLSSANFQLPASLTNDADSLFEKQLGDGEMLSNGSKPALVRQIDANSNPTILDDGFPDPFVILANQPEKVSTAETNRVNDIDWPPNSQVLTAKRSPASGIVNFGHRAVVTKPLDNLSALKDELYRSNSRDKLALSIIESGYLSREQLIRVATRLKNHLEDMIGLSRSTITGLYPMGNAELLMKIDESKLSRQQRLALLRSNYYLRRGIILASWPLGSRYSPLPVLSSILSVLAKKMDEPGRIAASRDYQLGARISGSLEKTKNWFSSLAVREIDSARWPVLVQMALEPLETKAETNFAYDDVSRSSDYLNELLSGSNVQQPQVAQANPMANLLSNWHLMQLLVVMIALMGSFLVVKLVMRTSQGQFLRNRLSYGRAASFRSLWSSHSEELTVEPTDNDSKAGQVHSVPKCELLKRGSSIDEAPDGKLSGLSLIRARLSQLMLKQSTKTESPNELAITKTSLSQEIDEACESSHVALIGQASVDEQAHMTRDASSSGQFRSSRSYIRSLIEVLTTKGRQSQEFPETAGQQSHPMAEEQNQNDGIDSAEVSISQMDISAAHLILDYMEKHLYDKERLTREWLELNGGSSVDSGSASLAMKKSVKLVLQKLAKVGLSEENLGKNRNPLVVPFDKNRVRLGLGAGSSGLDYINASYIHDDDPRRPTHIIAQGPDESSCGQFWQMVWEQGVSVIVMLTRLNENGNRMCHCYWPASIDSQVGVSRAQGLANCSSPPAVSTKKPAQLISKDEAGSAVCDPQSASGAAGSDKRRVSVTSVFNGANIRNISPTGQPIIANGDLNNNILSFEFSLSSSRSYEAESKQKIDGSVSVDDTNPMANKSLSCKLEVHLVSEHVSSGDYLVRNMYLINRTTGETRTVTQFHYLAWPETGVPENVKSFLEFRRKVHKSYRNIKSPILVHCSDGGGRSGTYTLIDIILERIRKGAKEIDPRATLEHLRDQRVGLCAKQSQFEFVLVALAEEIQVILNALPH